MLIGVLPLVGEVVGRCRRRGIVGKEHRVYSVSFMRFVRFDWLRSEGEEMRQ